VQVPFSARVWYAVRAATARGSMSPGWYEDNAASVVPVYEAIDPAALHGWLPDLLPATILDVGAGSGRDAAWLASLGHEVVASEPSTSHCPTSPECCAPACRSTRCRGAPFGGRSTLPNVAASADEAVEAAACAGS
jgi:SAM-dependent methyltransferase